MGWIGRGSGVLYMPATETVTVLITDLVGSTGLASRLGPVAADELRREHFGVLRKAVEATSGKEVKNIGDGLMVVFQGAADAVACAVSIQQAVERRNRGAEEQLAIREGIALGDTTCEEGDYFGMPVVEAARLCDKAIGGQILTTEVVRMIDSRDEHSFNSMGELALRGFPEPVPRLRGGVGAGRRMEGRRAAPAPAARSAAGGLRGQGGRAGPRAAVLGRGAGRAAARAAGVRRAGDRQDAFHQPRRAGVPRRRRRGAVRALRAGAGHAVWTMDPGALASRRVCPRRGSGRLRGAPRRRAGAPRAGPRAAGARRRAAQAHRSGDRALPAVLRRGRPVGRRPAPSLPWCWWSTTCTGPIGRRSRCCAT